MFYIVESESQLELLKKYIDTKTFIHPIPGNFEYHPKLTTTVALYIKPENEKGFINPINHDEGLNVDKTRVYSILKSFKTLYCLDRKYLLYHFNLLNSYDISLLYSMINYDRLDLPGHNNTINYFYTRFDTKTDINSLIPLSKLYEYYESVYEKIKFFTNKLTFL